MTITTNPPRNEYTATAGQTVFNYTFKIFANTDLNVYQTAAGEVASVADIITAYTVSGVGDEDGGAITLTTGATAGDMITIVSSIPVSRTTNYQFNGDFTPTTVNSDFDRSIALSKQIEAKAGRTLLFSEALQGASDLELSAPEGGKFLRWRADLGGVENATAAEITAEVSAAGWVVDEFVDGVGFTGGSTTQLTLSATPGVEKNTWVLFDGVLQPLSSYSLYNDVITFSSVIPLLTSIVEVRQVEALEQGFNSADSTTYDNTSSGMVADDVQDAIDELSGLVNNTRSTGVVQMVRTGTGTWAVYAPDGTEVSTSGTTTQGLQEAITYACVNGHSLHVTGGSVTSAGVDVATIICTTPIQFPPMQGKRLVFDWMTVHFDPHVTGPGMNFDSCMMVEFEFNGQIVYTGNAAAVDFNPINVLPMDPVLGIMDSVFFIHTVACIAGTNPIGVHFNTSTSAIVCSRFDFVEVNGANGPTVYGLHGIEITDTVSGFFGNKISCQHLHMFSSAGIRVGTAVTGAANIHSNVIDASVYPRGAASIGMQIYGKKNKITCSVLSNEGTTNEGIKLEPSAEKNLFHILNNQATIPVSDTSTTKDNMGLHGDWRPKTSVHRNGTNQTGVVTATWTKVAFTTEVYDISSAFDSTTNHRWTPGRLGIASISARVAWATIADATAMSIAIYKNGSIHREQTTDTGSANGNQGATISCDVQIDAITDYFEIYAKQTSGGNLDINGGSTQTWAMFKMID